MKKKVGKIKKDVTIEDLALMVQRGFEDVSTKADIVELRKEIKNVEYKLGSKIEAIDRRLDGMADYNRRIARLERLVDTLVFGLTLSLASDGVDRN